MSTPSRPKFSKGDKVFAKVRGYPPWPARVEGSADETPNKMKYHVYFYGTGETAVVKNEDICNFVENKDRLGKPKKHKNFTEALHQIEADLSTGEKQKLNELETSGSKDQSLSVSMDDSIVEETSRKSASNKTKVSVSPPPTKPKERKRKHDESSSEESEKKKSVPSSASPESDVQKVPEVLSRSGRKIKPKRFADYENDSGDENFPAAKPVSKVAPRLHPDFESEKCAVPDENLFHLIAYVNNEKVKIPLNVEQPSGLTAESEELWRVTVRNYAVSVKARLEAGEILSIGVEDHMHQWAREQIRKTAMFAINIDDMQNEQIRTEGEMLEIDLGIRTSLNIRDPNTRDCIRLLNRLLDLKLTPLMLKKHSDVVQTIKKVRRYIGNVPASCRETEEIQAFHSEASIIRNKADHAYAKFVSLFHVPAHQSFWEHFEQERDHFYRQTKNMTIDDIINMVDEDV